MPTNKNEEHNYTLGRTSGPPMSDLELPSGATCLARKVSTQELIADGTFQRLNSLMKTVQEDHVDRVKPQKKSAKTKSVDINDELFNNVDGVSDFFHALDKVTCRAVVKPSVKMALNDPTGREAGQVYTDDIDMEDKMFLFSWATGQVKDLESFRQDREKPVDDVESE